jgi:hypothetical protein
LGAVAVRHFF